MQSHSISMSSNFYFIREFTATYHRSLFDLMTLQVATALLVDQTVG